MEEGTLDKILGWGLFLGLVYIIWQSAIKQQEQTQQQTQSLTGSNITESGNGTDGNVQNSNVQNYRERLAEWQPLDWNPKEDSIKDLKKKLNVAVKNAGGSCRICNEDNKNTTKVQTSSQAIPQNTLQQTTEDSVVGGVVEGVVSQPTLGINSYSNHEKWKVIRGLDRRIIGYELIRDADITSR